MFRRILVPLDGGEGAREALPYAVEVARRFGSAVLLVQVAPSGDAAIGLAANIASGGLGDSSLYGAEVEARRQVAESYIAAVAQELAAQGLDVAHTVGVGSESAGIIEAAIEGGADLIVMATHAHTGLGRLLFGSVTDQVIRHAGVPVLAVPLEIDR